MRNFHAEIATGDHDRVREADDVVDLLERRGLFDLGHDPGAIPDQSAGLDDVPRLLNERQGDPIHSEFDAKGEVGPVLLR